MSVFKEKNKDKRGSLNLAVIFFPFLRTDLGWIYPVTGSHWIKLNKKTQPLKWLGLSK